MRIVNFFRERGFSVGKVFEFGGLTCHINEEGTVTLLTIAKDNLESSDSEDEPEQYWQWPDQSIRRGEFMMQPEFSDKALSDEEVAPLELKIRQILGDFDRQVEIVDLIKTQHLQEAQAKMAALGITALDEKLGQEALLHAVITGHEAEVKFLLSTKVSPNLTSTDGESLLMVAAANGFFEICEALADNGANINQRNFANNSAFDFAVANGWQDVANLLLDYGAQFSLSNFEQSLLAAFWAIEAKDDNILRQVLEESPVSPAIVSFYHNNLPTLLYRAVECGNVNAIKILAQYPIDPNKHCENMAQALHVAARRKNIAAVQELLKIPNIDVDGKDLDGLTPLQIAIRYDPDLQIMKDLIAAGASVNRLSIYDSSPLELAIIEDNIGALKLLLADPRIDLLAVDSDGFQSIHVVSGDGSSEALQLILTKLETLCSVDDLRSMINDNGIEHPLIHVVMDDLEAHDPNLPEYKNYEKRAMEKTKLLLDYGADSNVCDTRGYSLLFRAVFLQLPQIVDLLLEHGVDVNYKNQKDGTTALHQAIGESPEIEIIKSLLENGADVDLPDSEGKTPYDIAKHNKEKYPEVFALLEARTLKAEAASSSSVVVKSPRHSGGKSSEAKRTKIAANVESDKAESPRSSPEKPSTKKSSKAQDEKTI